MKRKHLKEDQRKAMFGRLGFKGGRKKSDDGVPLGRTRPKHHAKGGHAERIHSALAGSGLPVERVYHKKGTEKDSLHIALKGHMVPRDEQGLLVVSSPEQKANDELKQKATVELVKLRPKPGEAMPQVLIEIIEVNPQADKPAKAAK